MKWNGRRLIPAGAIPVYPKRQDDIRELLKPLSEKTNRGNVWVPVLNQPINVQKDLTPVVSPSPTPTPSVTPTITPTMTMTVTPTMTQTPTPSATPPPAFDADAAAFLADVVNAGGTTDATISGATDTLFTSLKSAGLYTKMSQFYPMIGGTASSMGIMGKRSSGTGFDITWFGGWSYGVSGATGNDVNTYGTFNISGGTVPNTNSHFAVYANLTGVNSGGYDLSINFNNQAGRVSQIIMSFFNSLSTYAEYTGYADVAGGTSGDFVIVSRNAAGTETIRARNGIALANKTEACNDIDNTRQWFLGAEQSTGGGKGISNSKRYIWVGFGQKLTDAELLTYQSIINTFQTTLGRNTY